MTKVSKEVVDAVRMARWEEWERVAKDMPRGRHVLSVELLRISRDETVVVLTVVQNNRLVQYELRGDGMGGSAKPVISQRKVSGCDQTYQASEVPHVRAFAPTAPATGDDTTPIANGVAIGEPPPKEPPHPGAIALGESLLTTTFHLGEQAIDPDMSNPT